MKRSRSLGLFVLLTLLSASSAALAQEANRNVCRSAYEDGQRLRRAKKLRAAIDMFIVCSRDPCPAAFQPECQRWTGEVQAELPTIVVDVRRGGAIDATAAVVVDGAPFVERVDGVARPLDPGDHEVRVSTGDRTVTRRILVVEGVKAQHFLFDFDPKPRSAAPPQRAAPSPLVWVLGGTGIAALGAYAFFGLRGLSQRDDVLACTPQCPQERVDDARRSLLLADIFLGTSVLALGGAAVLYLTRPMEAQPNDGALRALARGLLRF
jgi:hypothetical protein